MNAMTLTIETVILIILFTAIILFVSRDPINTVCDMPQPIIDRCLELGLVNETMRSSSKETKIKKLTAAILFTVVLAVFLYFVNKARSFKDGFLISYLIWLIVDWYDCFVLDWGWFCHSKKVIIPGTEDLVDSYHDYKFHFIGSCKGMLIGLPVCLFAGVFVALISMII